MPPFKSGLKRKNKEEIANKPASKQETSDEGSEVDNNADLFPGILNDEGDETDSDQEQDEANDSGEEKDEVLYQQDDDDADSTLGFEETIDTESDASSELTDSEADNESEEVNESSEELSNDSGAESGTNQAQMSSDESEKLQKQKNRQKPKISKEANVKNSIDILADKIKENVDIQPVVQKDEYESGDTSDEEDRLNTAGEVPAWWYREYPHVGYDLDGRRILRPPQRDQIDDFLKKCEDPDFWRTVKDPATGQDVILSKQDLQLIARLREGKVPNAEHDEYQPWVEWFSREVLATPLRAFPEHKRSFLPSRDEQRRVARLVHALKMGWSKTRQQIAAERRKNREKQFYNLWGSSNTEEEQSRGIHRHIPAPKRALPSHAESYNPPPEFLLDAKELKEWGKLAETPWKRKYTFLPERHGSLRAVPAFPRFVRERFLRCLDLYLAPRALKMRLTISPEELVPKLPSPRDLQPFPTREVLCLRGHEALVRTCCFDPTGQYIVSGSDDGTVKIWESSTGRCLKSISVGGPVRAALWSPAPGLALLAVAAGERLLLLAPGRDIGDHKVAEKTDSLLMEPPPQTAAVDPRTASCAQWEKPSDEEWARGVRVGVSHFKQVQHVSWHGRGDYLAVTLSDGGSRGVVVHQLSRRRSQLPLSRARGLPQCCVFDPRRPRLFVATQRAVRIYDLVKQELVKKLITGAQWISCMVPHPAGDNLLVGSYDRKCMWFDLELSSQPYQTLRLHGKAVRCAAFHSRYPLFATGGDDKYIVVSHGMVYNDLLQNPLLVPLKQLPAPPPREDVSTLALAFHPAQPWLLAAGADGTLRLYA